MTRLFDKTSRRTLVFLFLLISCFFVKASANIVETGKACPASEWPHERSDLKPDPDVYFGKMDNGFRFAIKSIEHPQDRVAIYLSVRVGSMHEEDHERGYAHFLEHMLFNGSKNFPPGKLVEFFQQNGMKFGADSNAHTSYEETVYTLDLPGNDIEKLKRGLLVMSDYAQGALLLDSEVKKERGIVLAEKTARNSIYYQIAREKRRAELSGTRVPMREPIGTIKTIFGATSDTLRAFYDKWYRPENMVLVVAGNIDVERVAEEISSSFSTFSGRGPAGVCRDPGMVNDYGEKTFIYNEPESGTVRVALQSVKSIKEQPDTMALQKTILLRYMALSILQNRLLRTAEDKLIFSNPRSTTGQIIDGIQYSSISGSTTSEKWQEALSELVLRLRQAEQHGFTEKEFDTVKSEFASFYETEAITAENNESSRVARSLVYAANANRVYRSAVQDLELYRKIAKEITVQDLHREFKNLWKHPNRLISVTGNLDRLDEPTPGDLLALYRKINKSVATPYIEREDFQFPYLHGGERVWPVHRRSYEEIGVESYHWENGVVLNVKNTEFDKNEVFMTFNFGQGKSSEPLLGTNMIAESAFEASGTASLSATQISKVLSSSSIDYSFNIGQSSFSLWGKALKKDTRTLFETLYTLYRDPGLEESIFHFKKERYDQMYTAMRSDIDGAEALYVDNFLSGNHKLESMPGLEEFQKIEYMPTKQWLLDSFRQSVPEISVVGDIDSDMLVNLVSTYLGALPVIDKKEIVQERAAFPVGEMLELKIPTKVDKALVIFAWETGDLRDIHRVRRLNLLADLLDERIRLVLREKLGITYSTTVYNKSSRLIPGYGTLYVKVTVEKAFINQVIQEIESLVENLRSSGVMEDELTRLKKPLIASLNDRVQSNRYWLFSVLSQVRDFPEQLHWPSSIIEDNRAIGIEDINLYIKEYLDNGQAAKIVIQPEDAQKEKS